MYSLLSPSNQAIDCAIGVVPLAGDIFDCAWYVPVLANSTLTGAEEWRPKQVRRWMG
jgi:hypothetical protein